VRWNPRNLLPGPRTSDGSEEMGGGFVQGVRQAGVPTAAVVRRAGFWGAILLPVAYLPLLLSGLSTGRDAALLGALIVLHLAALAAGHAHNRG